MEVNSLESMSSQRDRQRERKKIRATNRSEYEMSSFPPSQTFPLWSFSREVTQNRMTPGLNNIDTQWFVQERPHVLCCFFVTHQLRQGLHT